MASDLWAHYFVTVGGDIEYTRALIRGTSIFTRRPMFGLTIITDSNACVTGPCTGHDLKICPVSRDGEKCNCCSDGGE